MADHSISEYDALRLCDRISSKPGPVIPEKEMGGIVRKTVALIIILSASVAQASPILDGNIGVGEYDLTVADLTDPAGAQFIGNGLDLTAMHFSEDPVGPTFWMGVSTAAPITTTGDPTSFEGATNFLCDLFNGTTPVYRVNMAGLDTLSLSKWNGSGWTPISTAGASFDVGTGLEVSIPYSLLPDMPLNPSFRARLDGTGDWMDDQMSGQIPEPATLSLLALGGVAMLRRRIRRTTV